MNIQAFEWLAADSGRITIMPKFWGTRLLRQSSLSEFGAEIANEDFDISTNFKEARQMIGYCTQKDAIFPMLTVEEHL